MIADYRDVWQRRVLIDFVALQQLLASVHRTLLGRLWYLLIPLTQVCIYYFIVAVVFARGREFSSDIFIGIMLGILHYSLLNTVSSFSLSAIRDNGSILLQINMPPIVFVAVGFWKAVRLSGFGVGVFFLVYLFRGPLFDWPMLAYPVILLTWMLLCWIFALLVSSTSVFLRDLDRIVPIAVQMLTYVAPVIYPLSLVPDRWQWLYLLNPVAVIFSLFKWSLLGGQFPGWGAIAGLTAALALGLLAAHTAYRSGRPRFTKSL